MERDIAASASGEWAPRSNPNSPAAHLLDEVAAAAYARGASDIHFEPLERGWRVRLRIDGYLHELLRPSLHLREPLLSRLKVMARLDISERRLPQDGRLKLDSAIGPLAFRVNTLPTMFGEKAVLRRLDTLPPSLDLSELGFDARQRVTVEAALRAATGMIVVTGPTGSGKTLSLFSFLQILNRETLNVCTVEDPAEIHLPGLNQVSVQEKMGFDFATALRAFLRQDPDVIMVGEIRDVETADVALKAAQTGHRVLTTLHTNDAPSALTRLADIGVAAYRLAAGIRLITAQRLLRRLCEACKAPLLLGRTTLLAAGWPEYRLRAPLSAYRPVGCPSCYGLGYRGRIGVHQLMPVTGALQSLIAERAPLGELVAAARREGMSTLREAALDKVAEGTTSLEEAIVATDGER
ncbi:GspE/PulE family protein [Chitinasiproducens palmae]|uniref:GspE/PulE family protein n=1 Tax=Chitinasiproducens palmae TaxID=1770053 RepID=UPI0038B231BA